MNYQYHAMSFGTLRTLLWKFQGFWLYVFAPTSPHIPLFLSVSHNSQIVFSHVLSPSAEIRLEERSLTSDKSRSCCYLVSHLHTQCPL